MVPASFPLWFQLLWWRLPGAPSGKGVPHWVRAPWGPDCDRLVMPARDLDVVRWGVNLPRSLATCGHLNMLYVFGSLSFADVSFISWDIFIPFRSPCKLLVALQLCRIVPVGLSLTPTGHLIPSYCHSTLHSYLLAFPSLYYNHLCILSPPPPHSFL